LRVVYVAPPQPPSPVREGSDEESSPRASVSENGHSSAVQFQVIIITVFAYIFKELFEWFYVNKLM